MVPSSLYPFESNFISVNGLKLHYVDEGKGPLIFLIHGNPTWSFFYRNIISELSNSFRVIAPDFLGAGLSEKIKVKRRAVDRVEEIETLYKHLGGGDFSIVMHDWGGAIGTRFLLNHLENVQSITYLNTTLTEVDLLPPMIKWSASPLIGKLLTQTTKQFLRYLVGPGANTKLSPAIKEGYFHPFKTIHDRLSIWSFVSDIPFHKDHPTRPELIELQQSIPLLKDKPIQIVWGLKDPCFHRRILKKIQTHFPHGEVHELPHASHLVLEDEPLLSKALIKEFHERQVFKKVTQYIPPKKSSVNALYEALQRQSIEQPQSTAIIDVATGRAINFQELFSLIKAYQRGLIERGIEPGDRALMLVPPGIEFLSLAYAVMGCGALPVFIDPGMGKKNLLRCIEDAAPHILISIPKGHLLRLKAKKLFPGLKFSIWVTHRGLESLKIVKNEPLSKFENPIGEGMAAFTSGATGTPKGVVFTNEMLGDQLKIFKESFGFEKGSLDLPLLPIFAVFSIALGVGSVFPKMDPARPLSLQPDHIVSLIKEYKVQSSFGSPTLWDKIVMYCRAGSIKLQTLKRVLMAGAPVPPAVLEGVQDILPNGIATTPYGATECLPVTFVTGDQISKLRNVTAESGELGTPVGKPIEGIELRVIDLQSKEVVRPFVVGEIIVKGVNVSKYYLHRPDADADNKIWDGKDLWHRIGDVGYLDAQGNVYYCGRRSHVVHATDRVYFPDAVENIFNQHPWVKRSALIDLGARAGVAIEPFPEFMPTSQPKKGEFVSSLIEISKQSPITENLSQFFFHPSFPVDTRHNAKIFRDQLSQWAKAL